MFHTYRFLSHNTGFACFFNTPTTLSVGRVQITVRGPNHTQRYTYLIPMISACRCRPRPRVRAAFSHLQCANCPFQPLVWKYTILCVSLKWYEIFKKYVNRNSHIASSPISQSFFFEEVCCLI